FPVARRLLFVATNRKLAIAIEAQRLEDLLRDLRGDAPLLAFTAHAILKTGIRLRLFLLLLVFVFFVRIALPGLNHPLRYLFSEFGEFLLQLLAQARELLFLLLEFLGVFEELLDVPLDNLRIELRVVIRAHLVG